LFNLQRLLIVNQTNSQVDTTTFYFVISNTLAE